MVVTAAIRALCIRTSVPSGDSDGMLVALIAESNADMECYKVVRSKDERAYISAHRNDRHHNGRILTQ